MSKSDAVIAIPSELPGGLEAPRSGHFGRCPCFTIVEIGGGEEAGVRVLENAPHVDGGCLGPVQMLADNGVTAIVVGGIGGRPLQGLRSAGISVHLDRANALVSEALAAYRAGETAPIGDTDVCHG